MKRKTLLFLFACLAILVLAALPRSIEVINGNYVFGYDQGKHWMAAKSIVIDRKFPLIGDEVGGRGGFFQGAGWFYLLSVPFFFSGGDPYSGIILMLSISMAVVLCYILLFRRDIGTKEALLGGLFLALSPILTSHARLVWPPFVIPLLTVFYLWAVYRVLEKKYLYMGLAFFTIGVMAHFEIATAGTLFITSVVLAGLLFVKRRIHWKYAVISLGCFLLPLLPLVIFDIRHDFLNIRGIAATLTGEKRYVGSFSEYMKIVSNHWMIFSDEFFRMFPINFVPKLYLTVFLMLGSVWMMLDKKVLRIKRQFVGFLFFLPIVLFGVCLFYKDDLWPWWITELAVLYAGLLGIVCVWAWNKGMVMRIITGCLIALLVASYSARTYNSLSKELSDFGGVHKIAGKKEALDCIFTDAGDEPFGLLVFTPPIYTYAYDYLIWWHGGKQYQYVPPAEKKKVFYLLIEPDRGEPWRHKGWLETVIKDGTKEKEWVLPSGFIIEKRTQQ